ncbi:hypothetical protein SASPL_100334 [Salvia splendens]|uniref:FLZ-type domain-containing protein n=1 Tax=Salvia splendens TaxID=180675 RepID=A0A8X8YPL2_SALSN|nr:hypothetical protein SASPL_100334 [Salvia splendens]
MVGLSVILETYRDLSVKRSPQILSKGVMIIKPNSSPASGFLDNCFLCRRKLLPGNDIFMYKGDRAFCSVECRYRQIFMDEEESLCEKSVSSREGELRLRIEGRVCVFPFLPFVDSVSIPTQPGTILGIHDQLIHVSIVSCIGKVGIPSRNLAKVVVLSSRGHGSQLGTIR